jgi:hypothetical protein
MRQFWLATAPCPSAIKVRTCCRFVSDHITGASLLLKVISMRDRRLSLTFSFVFPITDKGISRSNSVTNSSHVSSSLYSSQSGSKKKMEAPSSDPNIDLRKSQSGVQKENLPPLRASLTAIEHFNIPEYTEDEPGNNENGDETPLVKKEENKAQRSAAPPVPNSDKSQSIEQHTRNSIVPVNASNSLPPLDCAANAAQEDTQTTVDSYQRQQELAMRASLGASMPLHGSMGAMQGGGSQQLVQSQSYGMQSLQPTLQNQAPYQPGAAAAGSQLYASSSYQQQPQQPYDLYSSHNGSNMSQNMMQQGLQPTHTQSRYTSQQNSESAGNSGCFHLVPEFICNSGKCLYLPALDESRHATFYSVCADCPRV